jgi:hypothetical protein
MMPLLTAWLFSPRSLALGMPGAGGVAGVQ